ncbi:MAG: hypothetical protein HY790_10570 [Deltaproteobacteria bacterium]|nr:hypothetical protein [Deltaproteobacteria bacterium]
MSDFSFVLVYLLAAALFAMGPLIIAFLIAPRSFGPARDSIYECGMPAIGSAWIQVADAWCRGVFSWKRKQVHP